MTPLVGVSFALVCVPVAALAAAAQWKSIDRAIAGVAELPPDKYLDLHRETTGRETATQDCGRVSAVNRVGARGARRLRRERWGLSPLCERLGEQICSSENPGPGCPFCV